MTDVAIDPSPATAPDEPVDRRRPRTTLAVLLGIGLLVDIAVRTPAHSVALLAAIVVLVAGLSTVGGVTTTQGRVTIMAAVIPAMWMTVRASPWVVVLDMLAVALLVSLGAALTTRTRLFDLGFAQLGRSIGYAAANQLIAPGLLFESTAASLPDLDRSKPSRVPAIARGVLLAVPVATVLGLLLASADSVFATMLIIDVDLWTIPPHVFVIGTAMWIAAGMFMHARDPHEGPGESRRVVLGHIEANLVLAGLIAIYALFATSRLVVTLRGDDYVVQTTGLTYAEYARSGFFQLLWAAGITLVVILALRAFVETPTTRSQRWFVGLSVAAVALTLTVVWTAIDRLALYEEAFGQTMMRLYSTTFAWWIGAVFVMTALALLGVAARRQWLVGMVVCSAMVTLLVVNVMNPERAVMANNLDRAAAGAEFDVDYALSLSDDSVPTLIDGLASLTPADRRDVLDGLCGEEPFRSASWNLSRRAASDAVAEVCADR